MSDDLLTLTPDDLADMLRVKRTMSDLLTLTDIADLHKCTIRHARDAIVHRHGFPQEAPTSTPRHRLWVRSEVIAFITRRSVRQETTAEA